MKTILFFSSLLQFLFTFPAPGGCGFVKWMSYVMFHWIPCERALRLNCLDTALFSQHLECLSTPKKAIGISSLYLSKMLVAHCSVSEQFTHLLILKAVTNHSCHHVIEQIRRMRMGCLAICSKHHRSSWQAITLL